MNSKLFNALALLRAALQALDELADCQRCGADFTQLVRRRQGPEDLLVEADDDRADRPTGRLSCASCSLRTPQAGAETGNGGGQPDDGPREAAGAAGGDDSAAARLPSS